MPHRRLIRKIAHGLGYRGLFLALFGTMFILIGLSVPFSAANNPHPPPTVPPATETLLFHNLVPIWLGISIWVIPGVVAGVVAWRENRHWVGFALLFVPAAFRFVSYFAAFWTAVGSFGFWYAVRYTPGAALYCVLSLTILLFSSWPEPPQSASPLVAATKDV